ncbi:guanine-nucleotide dissociation stimulator CDC25 [Delphinella strobiligena]|nr:guanine-nucleotide dissociation stimulator CDC25 [Delphinella strobiligena]
MNGLAGSIPGAMHVRALYDYDADDRTSLSFRQGDIIQVITQLESGWWDGIINGVRGWFPSNYCEVISAPSDDGREGQVEFGVSGLDNAEESDADYGDNELSLLRSQANGSRVHLDSADSQEEAAFWIPQATPDGRLFYFNTLTGVSTMELPMETPTFINETGPRHSSNVYIPDQTRPPAEMLAGGYEREEDAEDESSEAGMTMASRASMPRHRKSYVSDGVSPSTSMESLRNSSPRHPSRRDHADGVNPTFSIAMQANPPNGTGTMSFINTSSAPVQNGLVSHRFFDDSQTVLLTWNTLVEDMRRAVQRYREAVNNGEKAEFVRRAEDISDHLRLLLAAGSGTTDNHSGNPSIISTNKALYPHFREMMSSFSKLVLSSHFAAADFTMTESYNKCLQEAEGLLHGVYNYVEVARQQRGEDIPRLTPGFLSASRSGAGWQNNGMNFEDTMNMPFLQTDSESFPEPSTRLTAELVGEMEEMTKLISSSIRRLDEHLILRDSVTTVKRHRRIGDNLCKAAAQSIETCRAYLATVESINLKPLGSATKNPQLIDFSMQKQKFYDSSLELVAACQKVTVPLSDEWAENRGSSLEERLNHVRVVSRELNTAASQIHFSLEMLAELIPPDSGIAKDEHRKTDSAAAYAGHFRSVSIARPKMLLDMGTSKSYNDALDMASGPDGSRNMKNSKINRFFGEVPAVQSPQAEEVPEFLKLEHEGEIAYDTKFTPPQLRGGTMTGLVEQLTRHDRLDSPFNNTFLLTYRSFTTATELFELLVKRWNIQPPYAINNIEMQIWTDKKQKPIRFRVVNILKSWFEHYWMEDNDETSQQLMQRVYSFAKETVASTSTPGAGPLTTAIEQRMRGQDATSKRMVLTLNTAPTPIIPKNIKKLKFLDIDALEFARQLTIIESRLYCRIKPTETLNKTWQKKLSPGEADPASNVKALILHSNQLTNWVAQMILTQADVKRRVIVIKHFVSVADKCRQLNNFSTLTSIISALGTAPIARLHRTWAQVNQKTQAVLEVMRRLMQSTKNFLEYRDTLHKANPPCIPFFGVYLTDLTFIEDGIPSVIKKTNLINFAKRAKTAEVIRDIQQYQNVPYPLQPVPELQDYILTNMQTAGDVHEMYDRSLQVEPREREDEKIARLLSESGFL